MSENIEFRCDYAIRIPPLGMEEEGITVIDFTAINATTLKPKESKHVSLRKVQEQIFAALLQGYEVATSKLPFGVIVIKLIPRSEIERVSKIYKVEKRD